MEEPKLFYNQSYIGEKIFSDSEIMRYIGYNNYVMLNRKYPNYFKYFPECEVKCYYNFKHPLNISIITGNDPNVIKKDIIKTIYYNDFVSNVSLLVNNKKDNDMNITEMEDKTIIWILICIIIVILLFFSVIILYKSNSYKNLTDKKFIN